MFCSELEQFCPSWERAWKGLGAKTTGKDLYDALMIKYGEPHRKYHSLQHLSECLSLFASVQDLPTYPFEVEVALWFHDAIYEVERSDNEERSAEWARTAALKSGVVLAVADRIHNLIRATKHTGIPRKLDEQLLVDIDLAILGASQPRFAEYEHQIREEYAHVPEGLFRQKRHAILRSFLERERIYNTPHFYAIFEEQARSNLRIAIEQ
ncbi:MAG: hypothetical protein SFW36_13625 [Leptolyngbyaceae cyanobacterium bins.59]|nr:hypothetical protein [Leptolyngbyaceae cyanobacterium bins.59]